MNYQKIYNQIIERAKSRQLECYKERHHIIPKCLGGSNDKENLVELTAREHFLCHMLLCEIYTSNEKLKYALYLMNIGKQKNKETNYKISNRTYERLKKEHSLLMKTKKPNLGNKHNDETKEKMSQSRKGKIISDETKEKMRISSSGHKKTKEWRKNLSESVSKSFGRPVLQKDLKGNIIKEWSTGKKAAIELDLSYMAINACCLHNERNLPRKRDKLKIGKYVALNFIWEYKNIY